MKWMAAAALMLAPVLAWAQTGTCPEFKNPELKWNQRQGDNYTLCYAELPGTLGASTGFGIYLGHRTFKPDKKAKAEKGTVGAQQVQWYTKATPGNARPYSREAMIVVPGAKPKSKLKVYAWIDASSAEQLNQAFAIARQVAVQ
ncbi:hypothetical protein SAMN04487939_11133 [Lysobacter sp. yr284]|uniref:hypothetical protein n=1 Tax=Lysobacter TaxID=68 RepID=UPI0008968F78|nr:hypothetical protein [Lysobacter sp. yr284]SDY98898.1 hypothetical protein SAMN04487939_11133 [Lysobacter sp. yr284]